MGARKNLTVIAGPATLSKPARFSGTSSFLGNGDACLLFAIDLKL